MLACAITPLPLVTVQTWPGGGVPMRTEYVPPLEEVRVNVNDPLDDTDSASIPLLTSIRLPAERPDAVPPIEKAVGPLELEPEEPPEEPPQHASCKVKRPSRKKPKSFGISRLTCARSSFAVLKMKNRLLVAKRSAVALKLPI